MTENTDPPVYLTVRQLARALQLHHQTVYAMARDGRLPHLRVGGSLRFRLEDVEAALRPAPAVPTTDAGGQP